MIHYITTSGVGNAWVGNELRVLKRHQIPFRLHALTRPAQTYFVSPEVEEIDRETLPLYPLRPWDALMSLALAPILFGRRFFGAVWNALTGPRESFAVRVRVLGHLVVACHWARSLRKETVSLVHSQWIHSAGTVGMYGSWLLGMPFSFTGHAADLFRERAALEDKIRRAAFIICISSFHRDFYLDHGALPEQLHIVYCGIDSRHFKPRQAPKAAGEPFRILSSGRLVEKKGFADMVSACAILVARGLRFHCVIAGSGPLERELRAQIAEHHLGDFVRVTGQALKQEEIPAFMHSGDIYCLPCVWASDNDVDGLPQMLMEAMACGLPVISTRLVGIPDLIVPEESGILVETHDVEGLARSIERLMRDREFSGKLAARGRARVRELFDLETCLAPLLQQFRARLDEAGGFRTPAAARLGERS